VIGIAYHLHQPIEAILAWPFPAIFQLNKELYDMLTPSKVNNRKKTMTLTPQGMLESARRGFK